MIILIIFTTLFGLALSETDNVLWTPQGLIRGGVLTSRNKRTFQSYQKIPYAKPPIGDLRFKDPVKFEQWEGVLEATVEPPMCIQKNLYSYRTMYDLKGEEDCLYLNVYTPKIPKEKNYNESLLPVMFWIPGGGFSSGYGGKTMYGPHYLLDKNVVVVSINYRVGVLGFLSAEDNILPGNYGMKDQVLALHWVQDNIESYGGNPNKVTIFGESAGAFSVGLHLLSPLSKNLFHKAIMQSGSPLSRSAVTPPGWAKRRSSALATIVGCPAGSKKLVKCLREIPANTLVDLYYNFFEWLVYPSITFMPVAEKICTESSFLCKYPLVEFKQESHVPVLIGMNTGEGGIIAARLFNATGHIHRYPKNDFKYYVSSLLTYKYTTKPSKLSSIGENISNRYFPDNNFDNPIQAVKMFTGGNFLQGVFDMAINLTSPVYYYLYDYQNEFSFNFLYGPYPHYLGVTHGDDLMSLFLIDGLPALNEKDTEVSKVMVDIWTYFVINKKPTINGKYYGKIWPTFDDAKMTYLLINSSKPILSEKPFFDEYTFWKSLPLLSAVSEPKIIT